MESATDKIQLFTPVSIARKIGGDAADVLVVLKTCFLRAADASVLWNLSGDHTKPWPLSDSAARGDALVDIRTAQLCASLHAVTVGAEELGHVSKEHHLQVIRQFLMDRGGFERRQFHRKEIDRWLVAFGMHSEYSFSGTSASKASRALTVDRPAVPDFPMTRAALVSAHKHEWPTIERDLADASQNGLATARAGARGWHGKIAVAWARSAGKLTRPEAAPTSIDHALHGSSVVQGRRYKLGH